MKQKDKWFSWIFFAVCFGILCLFMEQRIHMILDSDMASELILAKTMNEEGRLVFTDSWYYPSELRVFSFQLVMARLFSFFENWHSVRVLGSIFCYLCLCSSYYYFCCQSGLRQLFPVTAGFLLLPFCVEYFAVILYGLFYLPHLILEFLLLGLIFRWRKAGKKEGGGLAVLVGVLSFIGGLGGQRLVAVFAAPLVLASLLLLVFEQKRKEKISFSIGPESGGRVFAISLYSAAWTFLGFLINQLVLKQWFSFRSYSFIRPCLPSFGQIKRVLGGWLKSLGYWSERSVNVSDWPTSGALKPQNVPLEILICVVLVLFIGGAFLYYLQNRKTAPFESQFLSAFLFCGGVVMTGLYMVTTMEFAVRYLLTTTVFVIPVLALFLKEVPISATVKRGVSLGLIGLVALGCASTYENYWTVDLTGEYREIVREVTELGYLEGYSTFWNGNILTELSNGQIDMRVWSDAERSKGLENIDDVFVWLQLAEHNNTHPEGACFVLLTENERKEYRIAEWMNLEHIFYESEAYTIWGYESYKELKADLDTK